MKKILFATTALVATAGVAAADVSFGGYGRFGLIYNEGFDRNDTRLEQRFRLTITGTTETDTGVKFEGRIRFQTDDGNSANEVRDASGDIVGGFTSSGSSNVAQRSAAGFAVSTGGFRLDVGHVSDVLDSGDVVDYYGYGVGLTSFAEQSSGFVLPASGFGTGGDDSRVDPTIKLRYIFGDFTVAASYTDDSTVFYSTDDGGNRFDPDSEEWQVGVGYNFGNYSIGGVYGNRDGVVDNDFWAVTVGGEIGAFGFSLLVADSDVQNDTAYGGSVKYDIGAATQLRAVYSDAGRDDSIGDDATYAVGVRHSLGGGVTLAGGVGQNVFGNTVGDLGVIFNF